MTNANEYISNEYGISVAEQALRELQKLRIQLKRIKEILEVKGMASNVKVSMIEEVVKGDEE